MILTLGGKEHNNTGSKYQNAGFEIVRAVMIPSMVQIPCRPVSIGRYGNDRRSGRADQERDDRYPESIFDSHSNPNLSHFNPQGYRHSRRVP